jgi:hypothetical protein
MRYLVIVNSVDLLRLLRPQPCFAVDVFSVFSLFVFLLLSINWFLSITLVLIFQLYYKYSIYSKIYWFIYYLQVLLYLTSDGVHGLCVCFCSKCPCYPYVMFDCGSNILVGQEVDWIIWWHFHDVFSLLLIGFQLCFFSLSIRVSVLWRVRLVNALCLTSDVCERIIHFSSLLCPIGFAFTCLIAFSFYDWPMILFLTSCPLCLSLFSTYKAIILIFSLLLLLYTCFSWDVILLDVFLTFSFSDNNCM